MDIQSATAPNTNIIETDLQSYPPGTMRPVAPEPVSDYDEEDEGPEPARPNPLLQLVKRGEVRIKSLMTKGEFDAFALENGDLRIERDKSGTIIIHPPMTIKSSYYEEEVLSCLKQWSKLNRDLGEAFSPNASFYLPDGSTHQADGSWISAEKLDKMTEDEEDSITSTIPDFVIETRSKTDKIAKLKKKMSDTWLANGVRLAWLVDPLEQKVWIYRADQNAPEEISGFDKVLYGEDVVPGFVLDLAEILKFRRKR